MKTKKLLQIFALCLPVIAAAQPTVTSTNYNLDGKYSGTPVTSINIDFSTLGATECPVSSTDIKEIFGIGYYKFETNLRGATAGVYSNAVVFLHKTVAAASPAYIYLPTISVGVGTITLDARTTSTATRNVGVEYSLNGGAWTALAGKENILAPVSGDVNAPAPLVYNLAGNVQLRLSVYHATSSTWIAVKSINVSQYSVSTNISEQNANNIFISDNKLELGKVKADVYFYNIAGQKIFEIKNAGSTVTLPQQKGIVKVVNNNKIITLKKLI